MKSKITTLVEQHRKSKYGEIIKKPRLFTGSKIYYEKVIKLQGSPDEAYDYALLDREMTNIKNKLDDIENAIENKSIKHKYKSKFIQYIKITEDFKRIDELADYNKASKDPNVFKDIKLNTPQIWKTSHEKDFEFLSKDDDFNDFVIAYGNIYGHKKIISPKELLNTYKNKLTQAEENLKRIKREKTEADHHAELLKENKTKLDNIVNKYNEIMRDAIDPRDSLVNKQSQAQKKHLQLSSLQEQLNLLKLTDAKQVSLKSIMFNKLKKQVSYFDVLNRGYLLEQHENTIQNKDFVIGVREAVAIRDIYKQKNTRLQSKDELENWIKRLNKFKKEKLKVAQMNSGQIKMGQAEAIWRNAHQNELNIFYRQYFTIDDKIREAQAKLDKIIADKKKMDRLPPATIVSQKPNPIIKDEDKKPSPKEVAGDLTEKTEEDKKVSEYYKYIESDAYRKLPQNEKERASYNKWKSLGIIAKHPNIDVRRRKDYKDLPKELKLLIHHKEKKK